MLTDLYGETPDIALSGKDRPAFDHSIFDRAAKWLYGKKRFTPAMLKEKPARELLLETNKVLKSALASGIEHQIPPELTEYLERDVFVFSGFKTYNELREASLLLANEEGGIKPFETFKRDVKKIDDSYNENYLEAEYNFATGSAQMAVKWSQISADGDRYDLQYRTAKDGKVRASHLALHDTTLPPSDPFWEKYYPPNGWNCFVKGTKILTGNGWREIEDVEKNDIVVGGSGNYQLVEGIHINSFNGEIVTLFSKRMQASCTPNHRFITPKGWIVASEIERGDIIIQIGKTGFFNKVINAIHNAHTIFRYFVMSRNTNRESVTPHALDN